MLQKNGGYRACIIRNSLNFEEFDLIVYALYVEHNFLRLISFKKKDIIIRFYEF